MEQHSARVNVAVMASPEEVWAGLTSPDLTRLWMAGAEVASSWVPGEPVTWSGVSEGHPFEDSGTVLEVDPPRLLSTTHRSGGMALADTPEDPHVVTYELVPDGDTTVVTVTQDDREGSGVRQQYEETWRTLLERLKEVVEDRRRSTV